MIRLLRIFFLLIALCNYVLGQTDTIFSSKKKIVCKIVEIGENEFKYTKAELPNGPVYVIDRNKVQKYTLYNGFSEKVEIDELSLENEHKEILANRQVIKIQPFSIALNYLSVAYERVIRVGVNLDVEGGYINNSMSTGDASYSANNTFYGHGVTNDQGPAPFCYGFYFKPGMKYFLGQDYSIKGLKYAHPLKGRYVRLDLAISYLNLEGVSRGGMYYQTTPKVYTNITSIAYGGFINYGRQFILGNILTLEYYVGLGFTFRNSQYSNPDFVNAGGPNYYYKDDRARNVSRYCAFARNPDTGISATGGIRLGYILKKKTGTNK